MESSNQIKKELKRVVRGVIPFLPLSIRQVETPKEVMNKKLFADTLKSIRQAEDRSSYLQQTLGIDLIDFEQSYLDIIGNLFQLLYNESQLEVITHYLTGDLDEEDSGLTITINKKQVTFPVKDENDIWDIIQYLEKNT